MFKENKKKGEGIAFREELADKLELLSRALRKGSFEFEGESWPLAKEFLEYKWEIKIKEGKLKFSLTLRLDEKTFPEKQIPPKVFFKKSPKQIKKQMGALRKSIWREIRVGNLPSRQEIVDFEKSFQDYRPFVDEAWESEWERCHQKVKKLLEAFDKGDLSLLQTLILEILTLEKLCHRRYK